MEILANNSENLAPIEPSIENVKKYSLKKIPLPLVELPSNQNCKYCKHPNDEQGTKIPNLVVWKSTVQGHHKWPSYSLHDV